jgi:3-oxoacyl-[acyl-carrier-protein] synthase II
VLESRDSATARNAKPLARLASVHSDRARRQPGAITASLVRMWSAIAPKVKSGRAAILSGASGAEPATAEERAWLSSVPALPVRATGTYLGHGVEPQFVMNIALAAVALGHQRLPAPASPSEAAMDQPLSQVVVTGVGHWRGEGMALVEAAG